MDIKKLVQPLVWFAFFFLLGGSIGLSIPFVLLVLATILHMV